jgi:hypothetical protein
MFEFHELTTSVASTEAANVDLGSRFYALQKQGESMPNVAFGSIWEQAPILQDEQPQQGQGKHVTLEDPKSGQTFLPTIKYGRSISVQDQFVPGSTTVNCNQDTVLDRVERRQRMFVNYIMFTLVMTSRCRKFWRENSNVINPYMAFCFGFFPNFRRPKI